MNKKPILNALGASGYIVLVVSLINFLSQTQKNKPDTFLAPILFLSLLTLSVTVMGYLFFYEPILLFLDGKNKRAVNFFLRTVVSFAVITVLILVLLFTGIFK